MEILEVLRRPLITEKATALQGQRKYSFEVDRRANKHQVKRAVETAFKVKVEAVNIITVPGKTKRYGRGLRKFSPRKKALVTLGPGEKIELFEGV